MGFDTKIKSLGCLEGKLQKWPQERHDFFGPDFETAKNWLNIAKIKKLRSLYFISLVSNLIFTLELF